MKPLKITRALARIIILGAVTFGFFRLAGEIIQLRSENDNLKVQLQMMATQAEEIVASQWTTASHLQKLDAKLTEQAAATFVKTRMRSQWDRVTEEIAAGWGDDAPMMQEFRTHPQTAFAQALVGMSAVRTNFKALEDRLAKLEKSLQTRTEVLSRLPSILPADGWVSSRYGYRKSPTTGRRDFHKGTDIAAKKGSPVIAAASGVVSRAGWNGAYGKLVEIDHGEGLSTLYAHNGKLFVKSGDHVERGQKIGSVGMTGRTTGAHVHYEVRKAGVPINPRSFLRVSPQQPFDGSMDTPVVAELFTPAVSTPETTAVASLIEAVPVTEQAQQNWPDFRNMSRAVSVSAAVSASVSAAGGDLPLAAGFDPKALWLSLAFVCLAMAYQVYRKRRRVWKDRLSLVPVHLFTLLMASPQPLDEKGEPVSYWS